MLRGLVDNAAYTRNDVRVFANAITVAGGILSKNTQLAVNRFLNAFQRSGLLSKTIDCGLLVGSNVAASLVKLIGAGSLSNNGLTLTYSESTGLQGNAATMGRVETGFIPTSNGLNASNLTAAIYSLSASWTGVPFGSGNPITLANGNFYIGFGDNGGTSFAGGANPTHPNGRGLKIVRMDTLVRTYSRYYKDGQAAFGALTGSTDQPNTQLFLFNHYFGMTFYPANTVLGGYWVGNAPTSLQIGQLSSIFDQLNFDVGRKAALNAVFFGDSVTFGQGASVTANRYSSLIASRLGITENNKGISGTVLQNTAPTQANNGRDRYTADVYNQRTWKVFILYGLNDFRYNNAAYTVASFQNSLTEVVQGLINGGVAAQDIVLGTTPYLTDFYYTNFPPFDAGSRSKHEAINEAIAAVAATNGTGFADIYRAMLNQGAAALLAADGHPNDAGHVVIANTFLSAL